MKFICLTIPAYGHVNPILGVMKEIIKDKHEVIIYNTPEFEEKIIKIGAQFQAPPIKIPDIDLRIAKDALKMAENIVDVTKIVTPSLIKMIIKEQPDCLLYDSINLWGKIASRQTGIKTIVFSTTMAINPRVILAGTRYLIPDYLNLIYHPKRTLKLIQDINMLSKKYHIDSSFFQIFSNENGPNIVFTSEYFQMERKSFDDNFKFVGPIIYDRKEDGIPQKILLTNKPVIYIALGTIYNDNISLYKNLIAAFSNTPYQVIISIGSFFKPSSFGEVPPNIYLKDYVPQLEVLKKASLFISHGGMNSINESLYYGVPLILLPIIHEQKVNSARVQQLGAGIYYKKHTVDPAEFRQLTEKILKTSSFKKSAEKIKQTLVEAGGYKKAAQYIYQYLRV